MSSNRVVSREEWLKERLELLEEEKAFTRQRDALSARRRELPWVRVEESYDFEGPGGTESLAELFGSCSQLLVYHFMFGEDWVQGCPSCSFWADNFDGIDVHLAHRDIQLVAVSKAPYAKLESYRRRMGWRFKWVSSGGTRFNEDFGVSFTQEQIDSGEPVFNYGNSSFPSTEAPGLSSFIKGEDGSVYHCYSTYGRGIDMLNGAYHFMDVAPRGRDEDSLSYPMAWLRRHDQYEE